MGNFSPRTRTIGLVVAAACAVIAVFAFAMAAHSSGHSPAWQAGWTYAQKHANDPIEGVAGYGSGQLFCQLWTPPNSGDAEAWWQGCMASVRNQGY